MYYNNLEHTKIKIILDNNLEVIKDLPNREEPRPVGSLTLRAYNRNFPPMHPDLLKLAGDSDMFKFYWRWKKDNHYGGEIGLQSIAEIFNLGWDNKIWFEEDVWGDMELGKEWNEFSRKLYGFDNMEESYDSTRIAAFYIDKANLDHSEPLNPRIWLWDTKGPTYKLTLSYSQYLDKILVTKGFFGWQLFFLDWDGMDFKDPLVSKVLFTHAPSTTKMEEFLEIMPQIFPDQDYTEYHQLYDNWKIKAKQYGF